MISSVSYFDPQRRQKPVYSEESQTYPTQLTIYYKDGHTESFMVHQPVGEDAVTEQQFHINIRHILESPWWIFQLPEQTVFVNVENVLKIEASPSLPELHGRDVFASAERITALNRASR